ncbi:hypothetical protein ACVZYT_000589 [Yersinia enterocolitica]
MKKLIKLAKGAYVIGAFFLSLVLLAITLPVAGTYFFIDGNFTAIVPWALIIITATVAYSAYFIYKATEAKIRRTVESYTCANFQPNTNIQVIQALEGKYIGIDDKNGTVLMVSIYDKNEAIGIDFSDIIGYECVGNKLTLSIKDLTDSTFTISGAKSFSYKLDILFTPSYQPKVKTKNIFSEFVQKKALA